jgi:hypothetical protein
VSRLAVATFDRDAIFQLFKYAVYGLLLLDLLYFLRDDWLASDHTFAGGVAPGELVEAFAATVDTAAWLVLLLLFELETRALSDERLRGRLGRNLHALRALCYVLITWAFWGYCAKTWMLYDVVRLDGVASPCDLAGWSFLSDLDEYVAIDTANCSRLASESDLYALGGRTVAADGAGLRAAQWLAWTDVVNAGTWLLVVLVLEIDLRLERRALFRGVAFRASWAIKSVLYGTLLGAAVYWGIAGDFVDFWDAFLWLLAFAFIEMNVLDWHRERRLEAAPG